MRILFIPSSDPSVLMASLFSQHLLVTTSLFTALSERALLTGEQKDYLMDHSDIALSVPTLIKEKEQEDVELLKEELEMQISIDWQQYYESKPLEDLDNPIKQKINKLRLQVINIRQSLLQALNETYPVTLTGF